MSDDAQMTTVETPSKVKQSARIDSRKRKRAAAEDNTGTHESSQREDGKLEGPFVDSAYQSMATEDILSADEQRALQDTPSKKRVSTGPRRSTGKRIAHIEEENKTTDGDIELETQDTIVVETPELRTSGRQRKKTWKMTGAFEEEQPPPKRRKPTPLSRQKPKGKPVESSQPVAKKPEDEVAAEPSSAQLSTPKKRSTKKTPVEAVPTVSPQQIASASMAMLEEQAGSAIATVPTVTASVTQKKRGRPPKNQAAGDGTQSPSSTSLFNTPSKRPRKVNPLLDVDGASPSQLTPSKKAHRLATEIKPINPIPWQQFKEDGVEQIKRPDIRTSRAKLDAMLEDQENRQGLSRIRATILQYLTGKKRMPLCGLDEQYPKIKSIVKQTVAAGESNSILLIGPRGGGKSAMVDSIVNEIGVEHPNDFHVIRLNGFLHTDDKLALREIWRQLGREMEVADESMAERSNYADTLASLLAVLSHPSEQPESNTKEGQIAKSVIFVIDEFDLFTTHPRQTLLYNLFDIAQSRKAPIAVLGLTTRVDVVESLEKRVKSRFSHRHVFLPRPKSFFAFQQIVLAALRGGEELEAEPNPETAAAQDGTTLQSAWSDYMTSLFDESTALTSMLRMIYATSRSIPTAFASFLAPIASLTPSSIPDDKAFASQALLPSDSKLSLLPSLTEVELALLISAARLDIILDVDTCNFNMAYDEYSNLANRMRVQTSASGALAVGGAAARVWSREAALGAWERLEILELIMPLATAGYGAGSGLADVGRAGKLMRCDVSLEEIKWSGLNMSQQMMKWCKEI